MSSPDFYSVVRTDKLEEIIQPPKAHGPDTQQTSITQQTPQANIFTPPLKKSAIASYDKIVTILSNASLNNIEKLSQIKQLTFNFNSDFARSQSKRPPTGTPLEKVITGDIDKVQPESVDDVSAKSGIYGKVLKSKKALSRNILDHLQSRGLEYDQDSFLINTRHIKGLQGKKIYLDNLLAHLTKKTHKPTFDEKINYSMLNRHFNLPVEYIDNNIIKISAHKTRSHSDSETYHSGSGSLTHLVKHAIMPKTITKCKRLKHSQNGGYMDIG